jgi:hypothetical protein
MLKYNILVLLSLPVYLLFNKKFTHLILHTVWNGKHGYKRNKLRGLSPLTNYNERETAALSAKLAPNFEDGWCDVVNVTDPYDRIHGFLDRSCYFFFQVAPHLYSRG